MLFVPADSERKLSKAAGTLADALIIDLEDSVSESRKALGRELSTSYLSSRERAASDPEMWIRINPLSSPHALHDLAAVVPVSPAGIVLPKIDGPEDLATVSNHLDALEVAFDVEQGSIRLLPVVTETPRAALHLSALANNPGGKRVYGFTWGAEDLSTTVGASTNLGPDGAWANTYQFARSQMLLAAATAGVQPVETLYSDITDTEGLRESTRAARAEGFTGRIAIHPGQVDAINEAFTPSVGEIDYAQRVVAAFASEDTGTVALEGKMLDAPHLRQAQKILALAPR
ncbi:HpcH/HpaI aldolase/citrate lyase family protein [Dietzia sp. B32]|uniref:HpcH/HpaI aldolase/citrate lyase family protein n=1 Tax=Dietzia sp. B32 TaxID=2915130 RepID=UPI0037C0C245